VSRLCSVLAGPACRAVVQWLPHAVLLLDQQQRVVLSNRAASSLLSVPSQQMQGVEFTRLIPETKVDVLLGDFPNRRLRVIEVSLPPSGRRRALRTVSITAVRLSRIPVDTPSRPGGSGSSPGYDYRLLLLEDVTDRAALEQQLVETEKQVAIGQLAAGIMHEVSNPLASLGSNLQFIRESLLESHTPEVLQALDTSLDELAHMRQILGTLSSFPARHAPHYEFGDLNAVVDRCVAFMACEAQRRRIELATSFSSPALACEMDARLIKQVLLNLLKNAMEATPEGGRIEVKTCYRARRRNDPSVVMIEVVDTGMGIMESDLHKVFRPLFSTKPRGTGLGLSFCRQVVEEHGGNIRLTSRGRGQGTVATVSLPVRQAVMPTDS
jgi:signal transduction histidine kinase